MCPCALVRSEEQCVAPTTNSGWKLVMRRSPWLTAVGPAALRIARESTTCAATALVVAAGGSTAALAQKADIGKEVPLSRTQITAPVTLPQYVRGNEHINVVVVMSKESVAQVRARTVGHQISEQDHAAIHAQLAQQHASVEPAIIARGGKVLHHFYDALNGMKIEIARSEVTGLTSIPGVIQVATVAKYSLKNATSVPFIGAPQVWQGPPGYRGEHIKIGMIDTGIDYTHANFGGPGTVAAYTKAEAAASAPADPTLFGPNAPKVKGGTDLVGDAYDADDPKNNTPVPDPNPIDCNG